MNGNSTAQLYQLAAIINVAVIYVLAMVVFYITARAASEQTKPYLKYYVMFFMFVCVGYFCSLSRVFLNKTFAIISNNILYSLGSMSMTYALLIRKKLPVNMFTNYWTYINIAFIVFFNVFVFYLWFPNLEVRIVILSANLSFITCLGAWHTQKRHNGNLSDTLLVRYAYSMALFNFLLPLGIVLFKRLDLFLVYSLPFQNIQMFLWAVVLLCMLVLDTFENEFILSTTDSLTGLKNRIQFEREVADKLALDTQNKHALMMIDIDDFEKLTEFYGFQLAEDVIKHFASLIKEYMPQACLACRLDTEEFLLFFENVSYDYVNEQAMYLQKLVADNKPVINNKPVSYSIHIGIALNDNGHSIYKLLKQAGRALHISKLSENKNIMIL